MDEVWKDERFKHIGVDPRFRNVTKKEKKVKIDKRFQGMFTDERFQLKFSVDKKGRPAIGSQTENYRKYYDLSSDEEEEGDTEEEEDDTEEEKEKEPVKEETRKKKSLKESKKDSKHGFFGKVDEEEDEIEKGRMTEKMKKKLKDMSIDCARGVGNICSEESSSDESSSEESDSEFIEHPWGELDEDAETTDDVSRRFAVCNMDWDRITATDLMVLFTSFLPSDGIIESVTIYPSEFGEQRMKEEEIKGPKELVESTVDPNSDDDDDYEDEKGSKFRTEKLREYQLKRLKYFYAVVVFNSAEVANKVYTECDGLEYESSATKLDLRFIPDDMEFSQEPREVCDSLPDTSKYKPRLFANTALQQGKVDLTWDETDPNRVDFTKKVSQGEEINEECLKEYLATSSDDEEESEKEEEPKVESDNEISENDKISKYRSLLNSIKENEEKKKESKMEMEISWGVDLQEKTQKMMEDKKTDKVGVKKKDKKSKKPIKDSDDLISSDELPSDVDMNDPFFAKALKKKGKLKKKTNSNQDGSGDEMDEKSKKALELLLADDEESGKKHFSLQSIQSMESDSKKKKGKWKRQMKKKKIEASETSEKDDFKIDVEDSRFKALYDSHHFNIDPADPHFRKTKAMEELIKEKQKRKRAPIKEKGEDSQSEDQEKPSLKRLVESVKRRKK